MTNEISDEALLAKIEPLLETVDAAKDVDRDLASRISVAELSGTELSERYRKLAILIHRNLITNEEARRVVLIDARTTNEKVVEEVNRLDVETNLSSVIGSMAISGFTMCEESIERCRGILEGKLDANEVVAELVKKHRAIAAELKQKRDANED